MFSTGAVGAKCANRQMQRDCYRRIILLCRQARDVVPPLEAKVSSSLTPYLPKVLVLGEDGVVGRALELLLRSVDCDVGFFHASASDGLETLDGVGLVLLCPGLSDKYREPLLALAEGAPAATTTEVPVLELADTRVDTPKGAGGGSRHFLSWPCRAETLKRRINAILLAEVESGGGGDHATRRSDEKG